MKPKTLFYCTECGNETPKWAGKCPACGAWNTIVEQPQAARAAWGCSTMVFHAPQAGHFPAHLGVSLPHSVQ